MKQMLSGDMEVVVAKDGSGQFTTIGQGVAAYPPNHRGGRFVIHVKEGVYDEHVVIDSHKPNILIYGDGIGRTIVTGNKNKGIQGIETSLTATFANEAAGFVARDMTFRNTAGPKGMQAVAFRCKGDKSAMFRCSFEGYQDTLYYQSNRQFYRDCDIYGTIDFIFGQGQAVVQHCNIFVRQPLPGQYNTVTADGRENIGTLGGLVIQNCIIGPDGNLGPEVKTYLGRPWRKTTLTMVMESKLGDLIHREGWSVWEGSKNNETCELYEFANWGAGANTDRKNIIHQVFPRFKAIKEATEATPFTAAVFLSGQDWLPQTGSPYDLGLTPPA